MYHEVRCTHLSARSTCLDASIWETSLLVTLSGCCMHQPESYRTLTLHVERKSNLLEVVATRVCASSERQGCVCLHTIQISSAINPSSFRPGTPTCLISRVGTSRLVYRHASFAGHPYHAFLTPAPAGGSLLLNRPWSLFIISIKDSRQRSYINTPQSATHTRHTP